KVCQNGEFEAYSFISNSIVLYNFQGIKSFITREIHYTHQLTNREDITRMINFVGLARAQGKVIQISYTTPRWTNFDTGEVRTEATKERTISDLKLPSQVDNP